jgi:hypothetical protein
MGDAGLKWFEDLSRASRDRIRQIQEAAPGSLPYLDG